MKGGISGHLHSPFLFKLALLLGLRKPVTPVLAGSFSEISLKKFDPSTATN
jgi:hypothetical protein